MTPTLHLPANSRSNRQQTGQRAKLALHLHQNLNRSGKRDADASKFIQERDPRRGGRLSVRGRGT